MASERCIRSAVLAMAFIFGVVALTATPAVAAAPEPLIVTALPDPDPNFVPPREPKRHPRPATEHRAAKPTINQAMEDLGRVTGQLELLGKQVRQARAHAQITGCA